MDFSFLTKEIGGSSSTYYSDYHYAYNGGGALRVARSGGDWDYGGSAGAFCWMMSASASTASSPIGSRLEIKA